MCVEGKKGKEMGKTEVSVGFLQECFNNTVRGQSRMHACTRTHKHHVLLASLTSCYQLVSCAKTHTALASPP